MATISWNNLNKLESFKELKGQKNPVSLAKALSGASGAKRVAEFSIPMGGGLTFNYAAKQVNRTVISIFKKLVKEAQLIEKFEALYNGEIINTGEKRMVLHHLTRGQLGKDVVVDGVNKRDFYVAQQKAIADFANKVHNGKLLNEKGEKYTTVCQIGIGGSDLGPRAMYLALENW
ncbi:MAG TPA: glucose-6-phosphate isomerase, partial [Treponema sp.]|nr:glucose-6-phosphate isomerase [Treponema sp.]